MADMMKSNRIEIEYIQNQYPFPEGDEYVVIFNGSSKKYDLTGWKLIYEDLSTGETIHTHHFYKLHGSFDPGERLCVISNEGEDEFQNENEESEFPGPHWDLFTDRPLLIMDLPRVRVSLIDSSDKILAAMTVERLQVDTSVQSSINIFIGHGRDKQWRLLRDHFQDQHGLGVTAYEMGPRAGLSVKEVLQKMLSQSSFAVLVLTGEDIHKDGEVHARENVVHELGLFQGRLGFTRAVILLEEGVKEFSNIYGLNQIRFSKGNIRETFGDVLATIRREFKNLR
jgi:predicted nucleotide-binding protein